MSNLIFIRKVLTGLNCKCFLEIDLKEKVTTVSHVKVQAALRKSKKLTVACMTTITNCGKRKDELLLFSESNSGILIR